MTNGQRIGLVVGIVLMVVAGVFYLGPVTQHGTDCGSAMSPKNELSFNTFQRGISVEDSAACGATLSEHRTQALMFGLVGLALVIGAVWRRSPADTHDDHAEVD